jgi:hypothetical protein
MGRLELREGWCDRPSANRNARRRRNWGRFFNGTSWLHHNMPCLRVFGGARRDARCLIDAVFGVRPPVSVRVLHCSPQSEGARVRRGPLAAHGRAEPHACNDVGGRSD